MAALAPDGTMTWWVWSTVALALAGFLVNGALALWKPDAKRAVSIVGPGVVVAAFAVSVAVFLELWSVKPEHPYVLNLWAWLPVDTLQVDLAFQVDQLSAVMMLIVTGVGGLIHLFSIGYMGDDPGYARYFSYLNLFIAFMLILVLGANFPVLFIGWEGVGLCSYLLIGFWFEDRLKADAGKKAFVVNRIGDLGFLIAMFLIWWSVGSLDFGEVFRTAPAVLPLGGAMITAITLFLFLGC
ncbi:MAG: NADH-quinone oxidoreductase subunit L, partial [Gemmatimonadales bacterium]|nr:NADH-quinone oxidoreductase subunit L [Gemmatimonadales bacterium]